MSEKRKEIIKEILEERNRIEIRDVNIANFESNQIHLIPYGRSRNIYTAFLPKCFDNMESEEEMKKGLREIDCQCERGCVCC